MEVGTDGLGPDDFDSFAKRVRKEWLKASTPTQGCGLNSLSGKGLEVADAAIRTPRTCSRVLGNILSHKNLFDSLQRFVNSSSLVRPGIS